MSFLVYLFVLLVAAGSVIFGLDWTQAPLNPPPYAKLPTQTATVNPAPRAGATAEASGKTSGKPPAAAPVRDEAAQAQASAAEAASDTTTASVPAAAHCNIAACSAAYRSFRASDCTYQPFDGERRVCTKTTVAGKVAGVSHPSRSLRRSEPRDERRLTDRRGYEDSRSGGWGFDNFFGGNAYDER